MRSVWACLFISLVITGCLGLSSCNGGGSSAKTQPPPAITVSVSPSSANVLVNNTQQFTAAVQNTTNTAVTWQVNKVDGGNSTVGTISSAGLYTAPDPAPDPASVTVTAVSQADSTKSASASVSLSYPAPTLTSISPSYALVNSSATTVTLSGTGFTKETTADLNGNSLTTTFVSTTQLTAVVPAGEQTAEGKFNLDAANPSPGGGTSSPQEFDVVGAALTVKIIDLPSKTPASVTVTGPNSLKISLTATQTITGAEGTYKVTASGVNVGDNGYYATNPTQTQTLAAGKSATITVDYYDIVPNTTKVLDNTGMQSLTVSSDGTTLTVSGSSKVAQSLQAGDVLVSAPAPALPNGILCKVSSVSQSGSNIVVTIGPATLKDAFERVRIAFSPTLNPPQPASALRKPTEARLHMLTATPTASALANPCSGDTSTFAVPFSQQIVSDSTDNSSITASGELDMCSLQPNFNLDSGAGTVSFTVSLKEYANVVVEGRYTLGSFDKEQDLATIDLADLVIPVGPVPVVITPELTPYVGAKGDVDVSFATGASQAGEAEAGLAYQGGKVSVIQSVNLQAAMDSTSADASLDAKGYGGASFALAFWGSLAPNVDLDGYLELNADTASNPWWTLAGGLEASGGIKVSLLGFFTKDIPLAETTLWSTDIAHAAGPFSPQPVLTSLTPNAAVVDSPNQTLALTGTNFLPGSWASFNGTPLSTIFTDADDLTAVLSTDQMLLDGNYPVTVTNPDVSGAVSSPINFTVSGTVVSVTPSTAQVPASGAQQFQATVLGPTNTAVTWSVNGTAGGNSVVGTIDGSGLYTAPSTTPSPATVTVTATSQASTSSSGSATVTIGAYAEKPVYSFTSLTDGAAPSDPLILGSDGYYYGTTQRGGANGYGTVFKVDSSGNVTTLHAFTGSDGAYPIGPLVQASDGYFYGTTEWGGAYDEGAIFKMDPQGQLTTIYSFTGGTDGDDVSAGLVLATDGYFYGDTFAGGAYGAGTVFRVDSSGALTTIYSFTGGTDGSGPENLIQAQDGSLYGTTQNGGDLSCPATAFGGSGCGTVFMIDPAGTFGTVHTFSGADGAEPESALLQTPDGSFYGTTLFGGDASCTVSGYTGCGTIFKLDTSGNFTTLHEFTGGADGGVPFSSLIQAGNGDFYGTTTAGGNLSCYVVASGENYPTYDGCGTVFQMDQAGNVNALYSFTGSPNDGSNPFSALIEGSDGFLYGTTRWGGTDSSCPYTTGGGCGTLFKVSGPGGPLPLPATAAQKLPENHLANLRVPPSHGQPRPSVQPGKKAPQGPSIRGVPRPSIPR